MVAGRSGQGRGNLSLSFSLDTSGNLGDAQPLPELALALADWRKSTNPVAVVLIFGAELCRKTR
jgi:hypothetical protein